MIEIQIHPDLDPWHGVCYRFETGDLARQAWTDLNAVAPEDGSWHVGIYRHQRIGKDTEPVLVSIVGDKLDGFEAAATALKAQGGEETELHIETWIQLVRRRVEQILALTAAGAQAGRHRVHHPPEGDTL